jgi:hypothetical protein
MVSFFRPCWCHHLPFYKLTFYEKLGGLYSSPIRAYSTTLIYIGELAIYKQSPFWHRDLKKS